MKCIGSAEEEITFTVRSPSDVPKVLQVLWPHGTFIEMDGTTLWRRSTRIESSVHLFLQRQRLESPRERIRIYVEGGRLLAIHDRKVFKGRVKYEHVVQRERKKKKVLQIMNEAGPIVGALVKERATLMHDFGVLAEGTVQEHKLKICLDRLVAFSPATFEQVSAPIYYVEFEGDGGGSESLICNSQLFSKELSQFLVPISLDTAKYQVAASGCAVPFPGRWSRYSDALTFYRKATALLQMKRNLVVGSRVEQRAS